MLCQFLLYNKMNQLYIYICSHISSFLHRPNTLPIPPLQVDTKHQADLPVLCSCFPLAIYFTFGSVYMSMPLSHFVPAYPSPFPCPQVHSLSLRLYSSPAPMFFRTFFFFFQIPYIYVSIWYFFFSSCGREGSRVQAQQFWHMGLVALRHMGSSWTRAQTHVPCTGRWILNCCATREVLFVDFFNDGHSDRYEVIPHCSFDLHFL